MKKTAPILIISTLVFSLIGSSAALADVIPEGQKYIDGCAYITNTSKFPGATFIVVNETYDKFPVKVESITKITDTTCIHQGKYDPIEVFALDSKEYAVNSKSAAYNPFDDIRAYPVEMNASTQFDATDPLVDITSKETYLHREYLVQGFDNSRRTIVLAHVTDKTNLLIQDFTAPAVGTNVESTLKASTQIFKDVSTSNSYAKALVTLKRMGSVTGYPDGTFKPGKTLNRAEFTTSVMATYETTEKYDCAIKFFTDVPTSTDTWYRDPICLARNEGIVDGYPDRTFRPTNNVNFAEAATILVRAHHLLPNEGGDFWYIKFTSIFEKINGVPATVKSPDQAITRGEMAIMMYELIQNEGGLVHQY